MDIADAADGVKKDVRVHNPASKPHGQTVIAGAIAPIMLRPVYLLCRVYVHRRAAGATSRT